MVSVVVVPFLVDLVLVEHLLVPVFQCSFLVSFVVILVAVVCEVPVLHSFRFLSFVLATVGISVVLAVDRLSVDPEACCASLERLFLVVVEVPVE
eukprot:917328-Amphidinium_carterae.3